MHLSAVASVICLLTCSLAPVHGYADGKVTHACSSMIPGHGHSAQDSPQHSIAADKTVFKEGDRIKVTLSGPRFDGFFMQARDANNLAGSALGSFELIDAEVSQLLLCGDVQNSAVSHTSKRKKTEVSFYWIAPANSPQHVQFLATVVEKYKIYWVKIPGPVLSQANAPPITTKAAVSFALSAQPVISITHHFDASGCGSSKFCIRNPSSCNPEQNPKCFFLSFKREGQSVLVEMSGPAQGYLSFALSHDQWMGDDDAYLCVIDDQSVEINPAYMRGRTHPEVAPPDVLQDLAWKLEDGFVQCSFRRNISIPSSPERFRLDAEYFIFLADGEAEDGRILRHRRQPLITNKMYDITGSPEDVGGSRSPTLIKFHGAFMIMAWMTTVSIGVIVARFFKPVWPGSLLCGEKIWFQVHRTLMITTVVLTSVAFALPFVYRGHWSKRAGYHPYLGCIVMALAILQPVLAVFRPPPRTARRALFNWTHWGSGTAARIIAVAAMFLGMDLPALDLPDPWDTYVMVGFVLWHVSIDILLEVHGYYQLRKALSQHPWSAPAEKLDEDTVGILNNNIDEGHTFKKIVLTIYICGNFAFLVTFLAAINQL
ncbi:putative ferric-chelate reductase 1 isoform X3 [Bombina bombina]|nr:putative ferric-chelate reductase 1 isoform X3 [Bombina bombina]XP_053550017.1 putative ferric-chelate reductase 1 isoform X3 [Bombina bombina]XP_053550018.1 putative ferric-chelate reductase 1 isoform X3 [Bombina bombina]